MTQIKAKKVILDPHPTLHQKCKVADPNSQEIKDLLKTMRATLKEWEEGEDRYVSVGLAAPQIDEPWQVVLVRSDFNDYKKQDFYALINPEITKYEGAPIQDDESCMSVHGVHVKVPRYPKIKVKALDEDGNEVKFTARGYEAKVIQHEVDHINGLIIMDRALTEAQGGYFKEMDPNTGNMINLTQQEVEKRGIFKR
ncbi:MAG: peptide deformylase [Candidatus Nomurabacteria bacterium]|nr:MAG: peptide deformylase [Candidatus Nomurabacteria bacterium]HRV75932.1 peptide deformylase [Candidatus Saccharimonadales bacterium]